MDARPTGISNRRAADSKSAALSLQSVVENSVSFKNSNSAEMDVDSNYNPVSMQLMTNRTILFSVLIVLLGSIASAGFIAVSVDKARQDDYAQFDRRASELVQQVESTWKDYELAGLWLHEACRTRNITRQEFRELYDYLTSHGLEFQAAEFIPNITHDERDALESESRKFYGKKYPNITYRGVVGFEPVNGTPGQLSIQPRSEQPFYFPVHFVEPVEGNEAAIDLDLYSSAKRRATIEFALETWEPALTDRLQLVQETDPSAYSVLLMHPGIPLSSAPEVRPRDLSLMVIRIPSLLARATRNQVDSLLVYIYDSTQANHVDIHPEFLGGVRVNANGTHPFLTSVEEIALAQLRGMHTLCSTHEKVVSIATSKWTIVVISLPGETYRSSVVYEIFGGSMIFVACCCLALWMYTNMRRMAKINEIRLEAQAEREIVSSLFPAHIRDRLIHDAELMNTQAKNKHRNSTILIEGEMDNTDDLLLNSKTSESIFGTKPIADFIPEVTVIFADLVGFTAWSSVRCPTQVFTLLETIYHAFDLLAKRHRVFKVETVGDCYVAVAGIPNANRKHAVVMAKFAADCNIKLRHLSKSLETTLGPDTGDLELRIGLHSGPVTAGVLRGDKGRFQLFGDTMNTASRMETTGEPNKIHVSLETASLLQLHGKDHWLTPREDKVFAKGKGKLQTFWLDVLKESTTSSVGSSHSSAPSVNFDVDDVKEDPLSRGSLVSNKTMRLVKWNVDLLSKILKEIMARRSATSTRSKQCDYTTGGSFSNLFDGSTVLDEVEDIISFPEFDAKSVRNQADPESIKLDPDVVVQLTDYVTVIAQMYRRNPFHNFEHASHVTMSVNKLMSRITNPEETLLVDETRATTDNNTNTSKQKLASSLHDHTFGITSDPLTQFACMFSALVHDVDHLGVPNSTLVQEETPLAVMYKNKSVAEQNSVDIAWNLLMKEEYKKFRNCIFSSQEELLRFRQLVVNIVMATDIMDKDLGALRKARWAKAFSTESNCSTTSIDDSSSDASEMSMQRDTNRKATIVIEHLIQASDVAHTMQHWHVFVKWNERLFHEMYRAYKQGRIQNDPSVSWFEGEKGFFDFYVIPLAKKLDTCGVFGVCSDEYLNYAVANRKEWEIKGQGMVEEYLESYEPSVIDKSETGNTDEVSTCFGLDE